MNSSPRSLATFLAIKVLANVMRRAGGLRFTDLTLMVIAWLSISSASVLVILSGATALVCAFWRVFIISVFIASYKAFTEVVRRREVSPTNPSMYLRAAAAGVSRSYSRLGELSEEFEGMLVRTSRDALVVFVGNFLSTLLLAVSAVIVASYYSRKTTGFTQHL